MRVLDLHHGCMTDNGADLLAACPDLKNLESLDVSRNQLTPTGIEALRTVVKDLEASHQRTEGKDEEREYLYQGDIE